MTPDDTAGRIPALASLRAPIQAFTPGRPGDQAFQTAMLDMCDELGDLWTLDGAESLETNVLWTALYSFPALILPGPRPAQLVDLVLQGGRLDPETTDTLQTLARVRGTLAAFEPPGFAAALWRAALDAIYAMIEHFVVLDDQRGTDQCFALLDTAEAIADKLSGRS